MLFIQDKPRESGCRQSAQSGSVFTVLLVGIAMASALSLVLYQTISGPMSSMVRVTNKTAAKSQLQAVSNIVIMDAVNQANSGDCDADGSVEPRSWRVGAYGPTGGGLIPLTMGAPVTDPWGTDYGYCVWDVGTNIKVAGCDGANGPNSQRRSGTPTPGGSAARMSTVVAIISAGPNRQFQTTCSDYSSTGGVGTETGDQIATTGDDIVQRFTYKEAASATSSIWSLKVADSSSAVIGKNLAVGPTIAGASTAPTFTVDAATGNISAVGTGAAGTGVLQALAVVSQGTITAGGAIRLAPNGTGTGQVPDANCLAGNAGDMRYNSTAKVMELCDGAGNWLGASSALSKITDAKAVNTIDSTLFAQTWNWSTLTTQTALRIASPTLTTGTLLEISNGNVANTMSTSTGPALKVTGKVGLTPIVGLPVPTGQGTTGILSIANGGTGSSTSTPGSVVYAGPTGAYAQDNANFYYDQTNRRLGLGTMTPSYRLHAQNGPIGVSGNTDTLWNYASYYTQDTGASARTFAFGARAGQFSISDETAAAVRMAIGATGNVGIGTGSPNAMLDVYRSSTVDLYSDGIRVHRPGSYGQFGFLSYGNGSQDTYLGSVYTGGGTGSWGRLFFRQYNSAMTARDAMMIDNAGNVGIGTTNPQYKLDVGPLGGAQSATSGSLGLIRNNAPADTAPFTQARIMVYGGSGVDGTNYAYLGYGNDANMRIVYGNTTQPYALHIGRSTAYDGTGSFTPEMTVKGGNVGIGATNPGNKLQISGGDTSVALFGPNTTWGAYLTVGSGGGTLNANTARVIATDGNLHLDSGTGKQMYLNYYTSGDIYTNVAGGNVGIGAASAPYKLFVTGDMGVSSGQQIFARYTSNETYKATLGWNGLQLGNNGANYIIGGRTSAGGTLNFITNNTNDYKYGVNSPDGVAAMTITAAGNINLGLANPTITSGSSYITIPNGIYISGGTAYFQNQIRTRGGIYDDANANLTIAGGTSGNTTFSGATTASDVYTNNWFRNNADTTGLYNQVNGNHWYSTGVYWNTSSAGGGSGGVIMRQGHQGAIKGYLYWDGSGSGLLNNSGNWAVMTNNGGADAGGTLRGTWVATYDLRAPIFYDSDNTGYYVNPASTSNLNAIAVNGASTFYNGTNNTAGSSSPALQVYSSGGNGAIMSFHRGGYYAVNMGLDSDNVFRIGGWSAGADRLTLDMSGNLTVPGTNRGGQLYTNDNVYLGYMGNWMSNLFNQNVRTDANPTFNQVYVNDWFRVNGAVGIYWQTYGGGWYMQDTTWIRSYNSKPVYMSAGFDTGSASGVGCGGGMGGGYTFQVCGSVYATSYRTSSDMSLKKNIEPLTGSLDKISLLRGVSFNWKKDDAAAIGVIAQEVEKVYPQLVRADAKGIKSVEYPSLVAPLIEAVKELVKKFEALEKAVREIIAELNPLKKTVEAQQKQIDRLTKTVDELKARLDANDKKVRTK